MVFEEELPESEETVNKKKEKKLLICMQSKLATRSQVKIKLKDKTLNTLLQIFVYCKK